MTKTREVLREMNDGVDLDSLHPHSQHGLPSNYAIPKENPQREETLSNKAHITE
jgi:hypothetical protein